MLSNLSKLSAEKTALLLFAVFFLAVMLILAIAVPTPTESQWRVFNVVLALVAGAAAAFLPGVLALKLTPWLRAGGSLAVFALVFLVEPAGLVSDEPGRKLSPGPSVALARPVVDAWLDLLDRGEVAQAYSSLHPAFKQRYSQADFIALATSVRLPLGRAVQRQEVAQNTAEVLFGERGYQRVYSFLTKFDKSSQTFREDVFVFAEEGASQWQPAGYYVTGAGPAASGIAPHALQEAQPGR